MLSSDSYFSEPLNEILSIVQIVFCLFQFFISIETLKVCIFVVLILDSLGIH